MKKNLLLWLVPLFIVIAIAPFSEKIDLSFSSYFYTPGNPGHFSTHPIWQTIFDDWVIPAQILAIGAVFCYLFSWFFPSYRFLEAPSLFLACVLLIGSGLFVHLVFKDHWGRPRPRQITQFGGKQAYFPFYQPQLHPKEPSKSFTCGHCTMGFYFLALFRLGLLQKKRWLKLTGLIATLILGGGLSLARLAQGGHFLTDILLSFCIMWWTTLFLEYLFLKKNEQKS